MRVRLGVPLWVDEVARRPAFPKHRQHTDSDVAIIGGGAIGCAIAHAFASAGVRVALFDADRIGTGSTLAASTLNEEARGSFRALAGLHGRRVARDLWEGARHSTLDSRAALRRLKAKCQLEDRATIHVAISPDQITTLRKEAAARKEAGIDAAWLTGSRLKASTSVDAAAAIRTDANGTLNPYRACLALAAAASKRGADIFERTSVTRVKPQKGTVDLTTTGGTATAKTVIVATAAPSGPYRSLARHFIRRDRYIVATAPLPAVMRRQVGGADAVLLDSDDPPHRVHWTNDDRLIVAGADQDPTPARAAEKIVTQRTYQLMYELSRLFPAISGIPPEFSWATIVSETPDGFPYIGPHRNYPHHLFALGYGGCGVGWSAAAARILLRAFEEQPAKADAAFGFGRART